MQLVHPEAGTDNAAMLAAVWRHRPMWGRPYPQESSDPRHNQPKFLYASYSEPETLQDINLAYSMVQNAPASQPPRSCTTPLLSLKFPERQ